MYGHLKTAVVAALVGAFAAGGSAVAATQWIDGGSIKPASISAERLTNQAFDPNLQVVLGPVGTISPGDTKDLIAVCPSGLYAVGGGWWSQFQANPNYNPSNPQGAPPGAYVLPIASEFGASRRGLGGANEHVMTFRNMSNAPIHARASVTCMANG